jgi:release factor glutamine methyltransferase
VNLREALAYSRVTLADNGVEDATLEGEVLLRHLLGINRTQLFSNPETILDTGREKELEQLLMRRVRGEPSAYITGHREFYGLDFIVDRNVLIPRPETELLVEKAIEIAQHRDVSVIVDAGTGCGAIAIALAMHLPQVRIYATDISDTALGVAKANCEKHGVSDRITLLHGDMLAPIPEETDMIVANPPYVKAQDLMDSTPLSHEPAAALNGGPEGLDKLKQLFEQARSKLKTGGCVLAEIGKGQELPMTAFLKELFPEAQVETHADIAGIKRVIELCLTKGSS